MCIFHFLFLVFFFSFFLLRSCVYDTKSGRSRPIHLWCRSFLCAHFVLFRFALLHFHWIDFFLFSFLLLLTSGSGSSSYSFLLAIERWRWRCHYTLIQSGFFFLFTSFYSVFRIFTKKYCILFFSQLFFSLFSDLLFFLFFFFTMTSMFISDEFTTITRW